MQKIPGVLKQSRNKCDYIYSFPHFTTVNLLANLILLLNYYEFDIFFHSRPYIIVKKQKPAVTNKHMEELAQGYR